MFFTPDQASLEGSGTAIVRTPLETCLSTSVADACLDDPEAEEAFPVDDNYIENDSSEPPEALLFMRRQPGNYVFCGRLETTDAQSALRLVDSQALRNGSTFHQLIGCRLRNEEPP